MSPEQVRGQPADHRADIFAVGAVLYEMLAGRRPFVGDTSAETMTAILKQDPPAIPGVSAQVEQIVRHCLEKEPAARYQSARDLAFQLRLLRHPSSHVAPVPRHARDRRHVALASRRPGSAGGHRNADMVADPAGPAGLHGALHETHVRFGPHHRSGVFT